MPCPFLPRVRTRTETPNDSTGPASASAGHNPRRRGDIALPTQQMRDVSDQCARTWHIAGNVARLFLTRPARRIEF